MTTTLHSERPSDAQDAPTSVPNRGAHPNVGRMVAHYRVHELIGAGGMGRVYRAEDTALQREVALKVMAQGTRDDGGLAAERFLREARALASVKHPNLVSVYQTGVDRGVVYLAMELLEGETLEARVRRGPLPASEVVRIGAQIAAGLSAVHARGLIHRDIKPSNVWLCAAVADEPGAHDVKILDFGLARAADGSTQRTEAGAVVGTPAYMSPEQARGLPLDARTDLFSLGCVLYALTTGSVPFYATNPMSQAVAIASDPHVSARELNSDVPAALSALIDDLLEKNPNDRPATADEVRARLRTCARATPPRRRMLYALVGAVWLAVAVLGAVALWPRGTKPAPPPGAAQPAQRPVAAPPAQPAVAYLADLPIQSERRFPPPDLPQPPFDTTVRVRGETYPRGVFMHCAPGYGAPVYRRYAVPAGHTCFVAEVALTDSARGTAGITFAVRADDCEVWQSPTLYANSPKVRCDVDLRGAKSVALEARTIGPHHGAHGAWIDPRFTK